MLAHVLVLDGGIGMRSEVRDGVYTGRPAGPFTYREGKAVAIRELAGREGIDLAESLRLLGLGVRPPDDARGGPPGGGEPRPRARAGGARGGLADHALRQARPAPAGGLGRGERGAGGRRRRLRGGARAPPAAPPCGAADAAGPPRTRSVDRARRACCCRPRGPRRRGSGPGRRRSRRTRSGPSTRSRSRPGCPRARASRSCSSRRSCAAEARSRPRRARGRRWPEKRTRCPRRGVRSDSLSVTAGADRHVQVRAVGLAGVRAVARVLAVGLTTSDQSPVAFVVALPTFEKSPTAELVAPDRARCGR